jgi:hypothetical protein
VDALLAAYPRKADLDRFVGAPARACLPVTPASELCEWQVGARQRGWQALAAAIDSGDPLNLICELPVDGAARSHAACSAHPRRSNRYSWRIERPHGSGASEAAREAARLRHEYFETADRWIRDARTLPELSRLMGALPGECGPGPPATRVCLWRTDRRTLGHGTLAVWIGADKSKKIRLECVLPADGSPRAPDSCHAEVGA